MCLPLPRRLVTSDFRNDRALQKLTIINTGNIDSASRTFCYRDSISFQKRLIQECLGGRELDSPASIDTISPFSFQNLHNDWG